MVKKEQTVTTPNSLALTWRERLKIELITRLGSAALNLWFKTCKITVIRKDLEERYLQTENQDRFVAATWHRGAIFLVWYYGKYNPIIMFSRSKDGELLARFAASFGVIPCRGSSSRGGREALDEMRRFMLEPGRQRLAATVMDGPRGPRFVAKKGMIVLAMETDSLFVPLMVSAWPALTFKKAWDRTLLPLPFSKVYVVYDEPFIIPPGLKGASLEKMRGYVEERMLRLKRLADELSGYPAEEREK